MAKFDVAEAVDELSYDFEKFVPGAKGVIPEPTNEQLGAFRRAIADSIPIREGDDGKPTIDFAALKDKVEDDEGAALEAALYQAIADLTSEHPTAEQIKALPYRAQRAFVGWVMGTFLRPEASAPATNR